jgi:hypothetical protein
MDGLRTCRFGGVDDPVNLQIALGGRGGADQVRLIGHPYMEGGSIGFGVNRDSADAHLATGTDHPNSDLSTIRNQNLLEHL